MNNRSDSPVEIMSALMRELKAMKIPLPEQLQPEMSFVQDLGMDSLTIVEYIARVELMFQMQVEDDEWESLTCLDKVSTFIQERLHA